ncbi:unnamed protein product (mitochondrion) [Plasmodiophora brassicae]|uniref:Ketoreductase domain-containing protein n=1 Tax=Plasmodiophora brassicae TaxID=37360 RepID=A0A3P3Y8Q5_PLABS|nr:unnamed protein product [Plasmodiophora brassicae]
MTLSGQVAIVTGGARGIGLAIARSLARSGSSLAVLSRSLPDAEAAAATLPDVDGNTHQGFRCDIGSMESIQECVGKVVERLGVPTLLVNNVGATSDGLMATQTVSQFNDALNVNLTSAWCMSKAVIRGMIRQRRGAIVHVGSVVGEDGQAGQIAYSAAKAGLLGLTRSMAKEFGRKGIRVNMVAPGYIETPMTERLPDSVRELVRRSTCLKRFGTCDDVAGVVRFLLGPDAAFITGQCLRVDGGLSVPMLDNT